MTRIAAGEILPGRDVVQVFKSTVDELAVVAPLVATYDREARGQLQLSLYREPEVARVRSWLQRRRSAAEDDQQVDWLKAMGAPLAAAVVDGSALYDNEIAELMLNPISGSLGKTFALRIAASAVSDGHGATVYLTDDAARIPGHQVCYLDGRTLPDLGIEAQVIGAPGRADMPVPGGLMYSPVTQCNMNCVHCISRHTRTSVQRLPQSIRTQLLQWCRDGHVTSLACDYSGDILWADARYGGELDFLFELDVPYQIDTNGVCMSADVARRLVSSRLYSLNVSLDAATEQTYKRVRRGAPPLDDVIENTKAFVDIHAAAGAEFPVSVSFTLMRSTLDEWPEFLQLADRAGVRRVQSRHLESYTSDMDQESLWLDRARFNEARDEAIDLATALDIELMVPPPFRSCAPTTGHRLCPEPWRSAALLGNGDIAACCVPGMTMGNLHQESMEEIWQGESYRQLRRTVNSPNPPAPCSACTYHRRHENPGAYLFHRAMVERGYAATGRPTVGYG